MSWPKFRDNSKLVDISPHLSLYIHIPFCRTKCTYCAFNTFTNQENSVENFIQAVTREIAIVGLGGHRPTLDTVYLGGGTPSLLNGEQLEKILTAASSSFSFASNVEISLEANPNDIVESYLNDVKQSGVNRLSIGMQSANSNELKLFARRHDVQSVIDAMTVARKSGFQNVNLDLIYGIPNQSLADWNHSLEVALSLEPQHMSLYALGLEAGTPLDYWISEGQLSMVDDDVVADMYDMATEKLNERGYQQYEISNWAQPGYECRHNMQYWRNFPYIGVGPGAHGYANQVRYSTELSLHRYMKLLLGSNDGFEFPFTPSIVDYSVVDRPTEIAETLITGLRLTQEGIRRRAFFERFGVDLIELHHQTIDRFVECGLLLVDEYTVRLTQRGRLLSNIIFREFV
ncbi:MAG: radical SAM family heme chaperone HemW [Anaerolineae bacterium]